MKKLLVALLCLGALTACDTTTPEEYYEERARTVKACTDAGGEWFNTPGWGEACNFDSRR